MPDKAPLAPREFTDTLVQGFIDQGRHSTALGEAARWGRLDLLERNLSTGLDVNAASDNGCTALMMAASAGQAEVVQYLIERGADVNAIGAKGATALMFAVSSAQNKKTLLRMCRTLLAAGAAATLDARHADNGWTGLDWAKDGRPAEVVELIAQSLRQ